MTGRLVILAINVTAPVRPMMSQRIPVKSPEIQMAPEVMLPAWLMAAVPIAFIG
jgi:hypothetical protein